MRNASAGRERRKGEGVRGDGRATLRPPLTSRPLALIKAEFRSRRSRRAAEAPA